MSSTQGIEAVPPKIQIGPYSFDVLADGETAYDYDYMGVTLTRSKRIKLDPRQSDTELPQTIIHEVLHALGAVYEIHEWDHHTYDANNRATDKINLMATALLQWIRDNPDVIRWLEKQDR